MVCELYAKHAARQTRFTLSDVREGFTLSNIREGLTRSEVCEGFTLRHVLRRVYPEICFGKRLS